MRVVSAVALSFLMAGVAFGQTSRLASELRTNYGGGSSVKFFSWYTYDGNGVRTLRTTYQGTDTTTGYMSTIRYSYNVNGKETAESTMVNTTTSSIMRYFYDAGGNRIATQKLNGSGVVNYTDSTKYNGTNLPISTTRYTAAGLKSFYHLMGYNVANLMAWDTMYEDTSSVDGDTIFGPTQTMQFTYDVGGKITSEGAWIFATVWTLDHTNMYAYNGSNLLTSNTTYQGNGASKTLQDSLAYAYDVSGNCTLLSDYDSDRTLVYTIAYTWQPITGVLTVAYAPKQELSVRYAGGCLQLTGGQDVVVELYDMAGRLASRQNVRISDGVLSVPVYAQPGNYVARVISGNSRSAVRFALTN